MDNDGDKDLVVGCRKGPVVYYEHQNDGTLKEGVTLFDLSKWSNSNPYVVDWNGDNKLDIIATGYPTYGGTGAVPVYILLNNNTRGFSIDTTSIDSIDAPLLDQEEIYRTVLMKDIDNDGLKDLLVGHTGNQDDVAGYVLIRWYKNKGTSENPKFDEYQYFKFAGDNRIGFLDADFNLPYITLYDVNRDGLDDIVLGMSKGGPGENQMVAWIQDNNTSICNTFYSSNQISLKKRNIVGAIQNLQINLFDLKGRKIFSFKSTSDCKSISIPTAIPKGIYILNLSNLHNKFHKKISLQ